MWNKYRGVLLIENKVLIMIRYLRDHLVIHIKIGVAMENILRIIR